MNPNRVSISVADDFSKTPGSRYPSEGDHSGQDFRSKLLYPKLREAIASNGKLVVDLDRTSGFGTSFLEESFGGLVRENGISVAQIERCMEFISEEEPSLIEEVMHYIKQAEAERGKNE